LAAEFRAAETAATHSRPQNSLSLCLIAAKFSGYLRTGQSLLPSPNPLPMGEGFLRLRGCRDEPDAILLQDRNSACSETPTGRSRRTRCRASRGWRRRRRACGRG
jgi:hypothetical protein